MHITETIQFLSERISLLEVMADLQPYRFEPERVPKNEEVNDHADLDTSFHKSLKRVHPNLKSKQI